MSPVWDDIDIETVVAIAREAGKRILGIYANGVISVRHKEDASPFTSADKASHACIAQGLRDAYPGIPMLSEEGVGAKYGERKGWRRFWLVDPLDGTREFIKRNGEFTVNIALADKGRIVLGVIYVPVSGALFYARAGGGAYKIGADGARSKISAIKDAPQGRVVIVASRSHRTPELEEYIEILRRRFGVVECLSSGSSLKFCLVAEGRAHLYPRLGPTMEWDTAAGQVIVEEAGGRVLDLAMQPVTYNKKDLTNSSFIVAATAAAAFFKDGGHDGHSRYDARPE